MNSDDFVINFNPYESKIIQTVQTELLEDGHTDVRAELSELNVYGPGSFFKSHKDTPRGENMFGSLVIILPTAYEGGELVLQDRGEEWKLLGGTNKSGGSKSKDDSPNSKLKYIALNGDVDHELLEVTSGYRLTITYNLYYDTPFARSTTSKKAWSVLQNALERLLDDPTFMPNGGHLGFGLTRSYPVNNKTSLYSILLDLKGADSSLLYACTQLSLNINARLVFQPEPDHYGEPYSSILLGHPPDLPIHSDMFYSEYGYSILGFVLNVEHEMVLDECDSRGPPEGVVRKQGSDPTQDEEDENIDPKRIHIFWVTELTRNTAYVDHYIYNRGDHIGYADCIVCLIVDIGPAGSRSRYVG
ncbi:iron/ascorbate-dependent oxidoreductase family protein [Abortiporus biennis]